MAEYSRTLAELLAFVDAKVGLENTLVVLSADHGGPEPPPQMNQFGLESSYVDPKSWDKEADVFVVFEPNWFINDFDGLTVATTHGSPWRYDTFVPVIFAGMDLRSQRVYRRIHTVDEATTLSAFVGTKRPSGASGDVLNEVMR